MAHSLSANAGDQAYHIDFQREVTVRDKAEMTISVLDSSSLEPVGFGGECFFVAIRGVATVRARVEDRGDGDYVVTWRPPQSGRYCIAVSHNFGTPLPGSPFVVNAITPEPCPSECQLRGEALTSGVAREPLTFQIAFRDKMGYTTHALDLDVFVEPSLAYSEALSTVVEPLEAVLPWRGITLRA